MLQSNELQHPHHQTQVEQTDQWDHPDSYYDLEVPDHAPELDHDLHESQHVQQDVQVVHHREVVDGDEEGGIGVDDVQLVPG